LSTLFPARFYVTDETSGASPFKVNKIFAIIALE